METGEFFRPKSEHSGVPTKKATPLKITGAATTINRTGYSDVVYYDAYVIPDGRRVNVRLVGKPDYIKRFLASRIDEDLRAGSQTAANMQAYLNFMGLSGSPDQIANQVLNSQNTIKYTANDIRAYAAGQRHTPILQSLANLIAAASRAQPAEDPLIEQRIGEIGMTLANMKGRVSTAAKKPGETPTTTRASVSKGAPLLKRLLETQDPSVPQRREWWLDVTSSDTGALSGTGKGTPTYSEVVNKQGKGANFVTIPYLKIGVRRGKEDRLRRMIDVMIEDIRRSTDNAIRNLESTMRLYKQQAEILGGGAIQQPAAVVTAQVPSAVPVAQPQFEQKGVGQFAPQAQFTGQQPVIQMQGAPITTTSAAQQFVPSQPVQQFSPGRTPVAGQQPFATPAGYQSPVQQPTAPQFAPATSAPTPAAPQFAPATSPPIFGAPAAGGPQSASFAPPQVLGAAATVV